MRVGYDFNAAIADIIDNSISANSKEIVIKMHDRDLTSPSLSIIDNGEGMNSRELSENMIIGCKDTSFDRTPNDLGRFGSGMKMASFSQARKLIVISKKNNAEVCACCWDIDEIEKQDKWCLGELSLNEILALDNLDQSLLKTSGTQLIWEKIPKWKNDDHEETQRIIENASGDLKNYLSLYFHKFLDKSYVGQKKINIKVQGAYLKPIDPFLKSMNGYQEGARQTQKSKDGEIEMQVHILPHDSNLSKEEMIEYQNLYLGQGLYIYRSKRLILATGWQGISNVHQLGKLARVEINIPSGFDEAWELDVQKSKVQLPKKIQDLLRKLIREPVESSKREYTYRGKKQESNPYWTVRKNERDKTISYEIQSDNNEFIELAQSIKSKNVPLIKQYLKNLQTHLPIPHIYATHASEPKSIDQEQSTISIKEELIKKLGAAWKH
jgi:hypothetical protein